MAARPLGSDELDQLDELDELTTYHKPNGGSWATRLGRSGPAGRVDPVCRIYDHTPHTLGRYETAVQGELAKSMITHATAWPLGPDELAQLDELDELAESGELDELQHTTLSSTTNSLSQDELAQSN